MSVAEQSQLINFCSGRSRLPASAADFPMSFKLTAPPPRSKARPDDYLPIAQTCFFSLSIPEYTNIEVIIIFIFLVCSLLYCMLTLYSTLFFEFFVFIAVALIHFLLFFIFLNRFFPLRFVNRNCLTRWETRISWMRILPWGTHRTDTCKDGNLCVK
jgi:HECT-domain (ubiquitin-transferase)